MTSGQELIYAIHDAIRDWCKTHYDPLPYGTTIYLNEKTTHDAFDPYYPGQVPTEHVPLRWATLTLVISEDIGDGIAIIDAPGEQIVLGHS